MKKSLLLLLPALALLGQGCEMSNGGTHLPGPMETPAEKPPVACEVPDVQVYYYAKATFTAAEIRQIERDVVGPMIAHYDGTRFARAVAVTVEKESTGIIVGVISDQAGSDDPVYEGVVLNRLPSGAYEAWTPTDPGEGYEG